jgi:hypothetical protein
MSLRDWLNKNTPIVTVVALLVIGGAIAYVVYANRGTKFVAGSTYYYDLTSDAADPLERLFTAPAAIPPIASPSGQADQGVVARVYSCDDCADQGSHFIGYLETNTKEAKAAQEQYTDPTSNEGRAAQLAIQNGRLVKKVEDKTWFSDLSMQGQQVISDVMKRCPGAAPKPCYPQ